MIQSSSFISSKQYYGYVWNNPEFLGRIINRLNWPFILVCYYYFNCIYNSKCQFEVWIPFLRELGKQSPLFSLRIVTLVFQELMNGGDYFTISGGLLFLWPFLIKKMLLMFKSKSNQNIFELTFDIKWILN